MTTIYFSLASHIGCGLAPDYSSTQTANWLWVCSTRIRADGSGALLVLPHLALLFFTNTAFFWQIEDFWQPCLQEVYQHHFSNSICSLHISVHITSVCNEKRKKLCNWLNCDICFTWWSRTKPAIRLRYALYIILCMLRMHTVYNNEPKLFHLLMQVNLLFFKLRWSLAFSSIIKIFVHVLDTSYRVSKKK